MGILTIWQKEWKHFFLSPVAYVILVVFIALSGFFFYDLFTYYVQAQSMYQAYQNPSMAAQINMNDMILTPLFHNISVLLVFLIPLVTMRLYAEEKKNGTDELLLTSPIRESSIVYGKYLGALSFYLVFMLLTAQFPLLLLKYGSPDVGKMLTGYLGLLMMGCAFISFGLFTSALVKSQIQASLWAFFVFLLLWILGWLAEGLAGASGKVVKFLALLTHFENFASGTIALTDIAYFLSFTAFFLFLSTRVVESSRWR
jgi:ABC-2 type transport system permease protein